MTDDSWERRPRIPWHMPDWLSRRRLERQPKAAFNTAFAPTPPESKPPVTTKPSITFLNPDNPANLVGALDPFARTELAAGERIYTCKRCKLGYHAETWEFLRANNQGNCVNCRRGDQIVILVLPGALIGGRDTTPAAPDLDEAITVLAQIPDSVGRVVLFQGRVLKTHYSQRGTWFLKFEDTREPFAGFTINIFPDYVANWAEAGVNPKQAYEQRDVRVRGLVRDAGQWGLQMIVTHPNMIMVVDPLKHENTSIKWRV